MKCHICGTDLQAGITDLPFKVRDRSIVVVHDIPVLQCSRCPEFLLGDDVMARVETLLGKVGEDIRLEVVHFVA